MAALQEDICWLKITMHDMQVVYCLHSQTKLYEQSPNLLRYQLGASYKIIRKISFIAILHHNINVASWLEVLKYAADMFMIY